MTLVVAGGGLAGAACAISLARAGRRVTLIEREAAPVHKICGEFISVEAQRYLAGIGFDPIAFGARRIGRVRLVHGRRVAESALPFTGLSLTRRALDEAMLEHAADAGVEIRRGHAIRTIDDAGSLEIDGLGKIAAETLFLATGKHDIRGQRRVPARAPEDLVGFKTYFKLSPMQQATLDGSVEIILFAGGYAGLQMVEGGVANLCLLADRALFAETGQTWNGLLAHLLARTPHLERRLDGAQSRLDRPLSIFRVPYGFLHRPAASDPEKIFRLGDQVGVIPSFSGDGMAIALHSAHTASAMFLAGRTARDYHRRMRRDLRGQLFLAGLLYRFGRTPLGPAVMTGAARLVPAALRLAASRTRVRMAA